MKKRRYIFGCGLFRSGNHGGRKILVAAGSSSYDGGNGGDNCEFIDITKQNSQWQLCSQDLPSMYGNRITTTGSGDGLIMTHNKAIYKFKCENENSCYFEKDDKELKIERRHHVFLTVPSSVMENC